MKKALKVGRLSVLGLLVFFFILSFFGVLPQRTVREEVLPVEDISSLPPPKKKPAPTPPEKTEFEMLAEKAAHWIHATRLAKEYKDNV